MNADHRAALLIMNACIFVCLLLPALWPTARCCFLSLPRNRHHAVLPKAHCFHQLVYGYAHEHGHLTYWLFVCMQTHVSLVQGGLVLDLSYMRSVTVDPNARTAVADGEVKC